VARAVIPHPTRNALVAKTLVYMGADGKGMSAINWVRCCIAKILVYMGADGKGMVCY
jgi:hypothetical protein